VLFEPLGEHAVKVREEIRAVLFFEQRRGGCADSQNRRTLRRALHGRDHAIGDLDRA
jgi:hypothetical protein